MHSLLVSHEVPLQLLKQSVDFNDFDYALVHLFETNKDYYNFYYASRHIYNREVLLDSSIFELGVAFNSDKYAEWITKLVPSCYIAPDVLEDGEQTVRNFEDWKKTYINPCRIPNCRVIGAIQGKTFNEVVECYKYLNDNADQIAISFDFSLYQQIGLGYNKLERQCSGRQTLIQMLIDKNIWNWQKPVHLLGGSLAREFKFYCTQNIYNIRSCDTSSPIMCGIKGIQYDSDLGNRTKPTEKLADNLTIDLTVEQRELIEYNVKQFKRIVNR